MLLHFLHGAYKFTAYLIEIIQAFSVVLALASTSVLVSAFGCFSWYLLSSRGGRVVRWCWVNFQCRGALLIWIRVEQGPIALAVGEGWVCLDIFTLVYHFFSLSPSLWGPIQTEILSQRAVKPKTTNQPNLLSSLQLAQGKTWVLLVAVAV